MIAAGLCFLCLLVGFFAGCRVVREGAQLQIDAAAAAMREAEQELTACMQELGKARADLKRLRMGVGGMIAGSMRNRSLQEACKRPADDAQEAGT